LKPEGWTSVEILPIVRGAYATAKLHIPLVHKSILYRAWEKVPPAQLAVPAGNALFESLERCVAKMKAGVVWMSRCLLVMAVVCGVTWAQQPIGTVGVQDATVAGALVITNGRAVLVGSTTVTARDHAAEVALNRGGAVRVCATSGLHVTSGKSAAQGKSAEGKSAAEANPDPLMLALDRGAIEVQMTATTSDVVMTPDLRFTLGVDGPLDLQLRVTRNGDTCVENRGVGAPVLRVAEQFGDATYQLRAGQHVLFEHGSLKEVVDHESSSCGCPPEPTMSVADALLNPGAAGNGGPEKTAAEEHPFPAAVSEGLAPVAAVPQAPAGVAHAQVSATLNSGDGADSTTEPRAVAGGSASTAGVAAGTTAALPAVQPAAPKRGVFHAMGRFFRRLVGRE
jgi:hypothetical protein